MSLISVCEFVCEFVRVIVNVIVFELPVCEGECVSVRICEYVNEIV